MPTTHEEKPAKPRQRSRKPDQRNPKGEQKLEVRLESDSISPIMAPIEVAPAVMAAEEAANTALIGEVLPPEVFEPAARTAGAQAIALAYGDYTRKSLLEGRFLVERLITVRSVDEAVEIQGEFAKQAYANFLAHSQKIFELYGEWAQQMFRPFDKLTTQWTRIGH
jgi:Phasin protein